jgi:hypothetical protein
MDLSRFAQFKGQKIDDVIDDIKALHSVVKIVYPKGSLTNDNQPERLNVYVDVHGYITSFNAG